MTYFIKRDALMGPRITEDPSQARRWAEHGGDVVRVEEVTEFAEPTMGDVIEVDS